MYKLT